MKRLAILLLGFFMLTLFPVLPAQAATGGTNKGEVKRKDGVFEAIKWDVTFTGATNAVKYRVTERRVTIDGHTASFEPILQVPGAGQTITQTFSATAEKLASGMGVSKEQVENWMNTGEKAYVSVTVEIYKGDKVLGTYTDENALRAAMKAKGFTLKDQKDIASLWGDAEDVAPLPINLKVSRLELNEGAKSINGSAPAGTKCTLKAYFQNQSTESGSVNIRGMSWCPAEGHKWFNMNPTTNLSAGAEIPVTWNVEIKPGSNVFTATINYRYTGFAEDYDPELFNGKSERTYADNKLSITIEGLGGDGKIVEPEEIPTAPSNLAVTTAKIVDQAGKTASSLKPGMTYYADATFASSFKERTPAKIRLYKAKNGSPIGDCLEEQFVYMEPPDKLSSARYDLFASGIKWRIPFEEGQNEYVISIAYRWDGAWNHEVKESTYDDNYRNFSGTGSDEPWKAPDPPDIRTSEGFFPAEGPIMEEKKVIKEETVIGWRKIKFHRDDAKPKIKVRLVPNSDD